MEEVAGHLVHDSLRALRKPVQARQVFAADVTKRTTGHLGCRRLPVRQLARAKDLRVRSEDLLGERRAGAPHADEKYGARGTCGVAVRLGEPFAVIEPSEEIHLACEFAAVVESVEAARQLVRLPVVSERLGELADVVEILPERIAQAHLTPRGQTACNELLHLSEPGMIGA